MIVVGSANTDLTVRTERLPRSGETVIGDEFMLSYGGEGANQALAADESLPEAIRFANAAGALSTTRRGAQESLPTRQEIEKLLKC